MSSQDPVSRKTTLQDSYTEMSEILMPNDTNNLGRALGGSVLHWMDICGAISARRFSNRQVVTPLQWITSILWLQSTWAMS